MPPGVDREALYLYLVDSFGEETAKAWWKWLSVDFRGWGREGWTRLDNARKACPK